MDTVYMYLGLQKAGVDARKYNMHSFRIGAATMAAAKGVEDSIWEDEKVLRTSSMC